MPVTKPLEGWQWKLITKHLFFYFFTEKVIPTKEKKEKEKLKVKKKKKNADDLVSLTTALSWVGGGCPGASTVISQPLDSKTLPWLAIPVTQSWAPTQEHLGTSHTVITVEREKKGGVVGGKQKNKKSTNTENNGLRKK